MAFVKYHDELKKVILEHKGDILQTSEIKHKFEEAYPDCDIRFMQPSDHCINKTNNGPCKCSMTEEALFEFIEWGKYKVR
jgi:hypothetical protein